MCEQSLGVLRLLLLHSLKSSWFVRIYYRGEKLSAWYVVKALVRKRPLALHQVLKVLKSTHCSKRKKNSRHLQHDFVPLHVHHTTRIPYASVACLLLFRTFDTVEQVNFTGYFSSSDQLLERNTKKFFIDNFLVIELTYLQLSLLQPDGIIRTMNQVVGVKVWSDASVAVERERKSTRTIAVGQRGALWTCLYCLPTLVHVPQRLFYRASTVSHNAVKFHILSLLWRYLIFVRGVP